MKIDVSLDALNFLRAHGGEVYLWVDVNPDSGEGTLKTSNRAPRGDHDFVRYEGPGSPCIARRASRLPRLWASRSAAGPARTYA